MSFQRISLLILVILSFAAASWYLVDTLFPPMPEPVPPPEAAPATPPPPRATAQPTPRPVSPPSAARPVPPPPQAAPTTEEEEDRTEQEEMDAALAQLGSPDPTQRLEGAEILGAYPSEETELALAQVLNSDPEADVRNAAAQSLGYVEQPSDDTVAALMAALEDQNEEVRASALSSLEDYLAATDEGSKRYRQLDAGLRAKMSNQGTPKDIREAIHDILQDQAEQATH